MDAEEARSRARSMLLATRGRGEASSGAARGTPFENVAEDVLRRYDRIWKLSSPGENRVDYRNNILPRFRDHQSVTLNSELCPFGFSCSIRAWLGR